MPEETETVTGNSAQEQNTKDQKDNADANSSDNQNGQPVEVQVTSENDSQPSVEACILKTNLSSETQSEPQHEPDIDSHTSLNMNSRPKSPEIIATEAFLLNEQIPQETDVPSEPTQVPEPELLPEALEATEPRTPANSEASDGGAPLSSEKPHDSTPVQIVEVSIYSEAVVSAPIEEPTTINGDASEEPPKEDLAAEIEEPAPQNQLTNGQSNRECKLEPRKVTDPEPEPHPVEKNQVLIGAIANELIAEDYKLPDVVEVKKHFEYVEPAQNGVSLAPPKKGALSTRLDSKSVKQAYEDVRYDGSETQWAIFKFEGPTIVTSATGSDFTQFKDHFGEDERAFGYIRIQTGDEMSKRAKFLLVTWVGPSVSVLKRAKMSTDKALMKGILTNFAVELQTENISDINLQNFETELDKAAGAHYGTGVRG